MHIIAHILLLLVMPPFLVGVINWVKAIFGGRRGQPLLQLYFDIWRLVRKGAVYSTTTTWIFRAGPIVALASAIVAGLIIPLTGNPAPVHFSGDVIVFAYLLGLGRFFMMAAALDTGSAFEGMGASREAAFATFAEVILFLGLGTLALSGGMASFSAALHTLSGFHWTPSHPVFLIVAVVLFIVLLAESSRIPFDDPNTHLELTMIHEVMVLDHGGPDLAFVVYGAAIKLFVLAALLIDFLLPVSAQGGWSGMALMVVGELAIAVVIGLVESTTARFRLVRIPGFLIGVCAIAALGIAILLYRGHLTVHGGLSQTPAPQRASVCGAPPPMSAGPGARRAEASSPPRLAAHVFARAPLTPAQPLKPRGHP